MSYEGQTGEEYDLVIFEKTPVNNCINQELSIDVIGKCILKKKQWRSLSVLPLYLNRYGITKKKFFYHFIYIFLLR